MKIDILCVGKVKESFYRDALKEYTKRLSRYCNMNIIEVPDEKTPDKASENEELLIKQKEGKKLIEHISDNAFVVTLEIKGEMLTSEQLASKLEKLATTGVSHMQFVIGGSLGLSDEVIRRADMHLSFSKMTFPHQLMRVILLEQIYRGYRIIAGEPYHK